jgi:hypothetical protein
LNLITRLIELVRPAPKSPEDLAANAEAARLRAEMKTTRISQETIAGQTFQSGRRSDE